MHFNDWPVWARPKDEQTNKLTPLEQAVAPTIQQVMQEAVKVVARKKPGPKPRVK